MRELFHTKSSLQIQNSLSAATKLNTYTYVLKIYRSHSRILCVRVMVISLGAFAELGAIDWRAKWLCAKMQQRRPEGAVCI